MTAEPSYKPARNGREEKEKKKKNYTLQSTLFPGQRTHKSQMCPPETYCGKAYRGANCFFVSFAALCRNVAFHLIVLLGL